MVSEQLVLRGIRDARVLSAMKKVPRHEFLPPLYRGMAYADSTFPIGKGRTIAQPYLVARISECLRLSGSEKVLEIGTGSGYQAAVLGWLARQVYTVERMRAFADAAVRTFARLGYGNIEVVRQRPERYGPYDRIIVTTGVSRIPPELVRQLRDGGILVIPVGGGLTQTLVVAKKKGRLLIKEKGPLCSFGR